MDDRTQTVRAVVCGDARIAQSFLNQSLWPWIDQRLEVKCVGLSIGPTGGTLMAQGVYAQIPHDYADLQFMVIGDLLSNPAGFYERSAWPSWRFHLASAAEHSPVLDLLSFQVDEHPGSDEVTVQVSVRSRSEETPPEGEIEWWAQRLAGPAWSAEPALG